MNELVFSGGGKSSSPSVASDNLRSEDNAEIILGLCEGPIEGLRDGEQSFFIDDTPLMGSNGEYNFTEYNLETTKGDASVDETIKYTLGGTAKGHNVGLEIKEKNASLSRNTDSANIDYIDVRIAVGALYYQDGDGNVSGASGYFKIEYKKNTDSEWTRYRNRDLYIQGKTTSTYVKDYRINVEKDDTPGRYYQVKVTRISDASSTSSTGYFFTMYFSQYEEVNAQEREFKNTAIAHLTIKTSDQVASLPQLYGIYKLLKIRVPSNYDPITHTYDGLWDGTFKMAWTDNPAWCLYDLIVNDRYGVNAYYPVIPDKWDFYAAGKYCDELVEDGVGGLEPRYTFNYLITEAQSGPEMLNYIASTFNAIIYEDSGGFLRLSFEDNNQQAVQIFNPTNINAMGFNYTFTDQSNRYNDYTVTFINPDLNWEEDRRRVIQPYGQESIDTYGRIPYNFNAIGCLKESEAIRKARFNLITSLKETMIVTFNTNRVSANINLFDTILVADPDMNYSQTGRIKGLSEDRATVYLRDEVFLEAGSEYEFNIQSSIGIFKCNLIISEIGRVRALKLNTSLPDNVDEKSVFTLSGTDSIYGNPKPFKVISITENNGNPDDVTIVAKEIYRNKQQEADTGIVLESSTDVSTRPNYTIIPQVSTVTFKETFNVQRLENALILGVVLDWDSYPYYNGKFRVYSRLKNQEEVWTERTVEDGDTIYAHPSGLYEFRVIPATTLGLYPNFNSAPIFEYDVSETASEAPNKVENFRATGNIDNIYLKWDISSVNDKYEIRLGEEWETADIIGPDIPTNEFYYTDITDDNQYKFMIKAINLAGLYSEYPSIAYGSLSAPKKVKKFYVTPNLDSLRFDWVSEEENYVSYEVRVGATWESGTSLFTTSGDNQTVLNPGTSDESIFFIKALSRKGIYSREALQAKIKQNLKQNRNVVLKVDNGDGVLNYFEDSDQSETQIKTPWYGVTHGLIDLPNTEPRAKVMVDNYSNAEHFFPIHLPNSSGDKTIARNWYDVEFFRYGERLTWEDLNWSWNSEEANSTSWLNTEDFTDSSGKIENLITVAKDPSDYVNYLGLRFNETTTDISGEITPSEEYKVVYSDSKFYKGVTLYKAMKLKYSLVDVPSEFSFRFKLYVNASTPKNIKIMKLSNDLGSFIDVYLENNKIKVIRSDGVELFGDYTNRNYLDYINIMITQSSDKLILDYFIEYANISNRVEVDCQPLGSFTNLFFGSRYE